jgi:hypothetical protein
LLHPPRLEDGQAVAEAVSRQSPNSRPTVLNDWIGELDPQTFSVDKANPLLSPGIPTRLQQN